MTRTHITIPDSTNPKVKSYCESNNLKYSQSVTKLIKLGFNNIELNKSITKNNIFMDKINHKLNYTIQLLKQFYSDIEIEHLTNPNNNKALQKFKNKFNKLDQKLY
jgi:hypothetical protein